MTTNRDTRQRILLVDDDAVIAHVYRTKLLEAGYAVDVAEDGIVALRLLNTNPPNLVVLDIMMPKFNGLEVLEFIRSRPDLSGVKVVVLSNFYFDGNDRRIVQTKADCSLVKSSCTPVKLIETVAALLPGRERAVASAAVAAVPGNNPTPATVQPVLAGSGHLAAPANARVDFLNNAPYTMANLQHLTEAFIRSEAGHAQATRLLELYRKVHFVTALAGQAGCTRISLLMNGFEALLLELHEKPEHINVSTLQTVASTQDFLAVLFAHAAQDSATSGFYARALVVDDEPISARAVSSALHRAGFNVVTLHESVVAFAKLRKESFDLILLDLEMPGFDGFELCERIRALPRYQQIPIICVTGRMDFLSQADTFPSGVNDVIVKPFLPIELALKAVTHWLRARLSAGAAPA